MMFQWPLARSRAAAWILGLIVVLISESTVRGQGSQDLTPLVRQVDPCVVTITLDTQSEGSGFVIDGKGLIVTNYHVIEGAKQAKVIFADKQSFDVDGFLAIAPGKDLALLQFKPGAKQLPALRLADNLPAKGERVFAFGAPMGLSGSVSEGIIAAIRQGEDVRQTLQKLAKRDIYKEILGYDLDVQWIQTTAPISPGNSGGPLVNGRGEVVGINSWTHAVGQNLNFSLCAAHIKQLMTTAGTNLQPLSSLPAPRPGRAQSKKGDAQKTLALWKQLNQLKNDLNQKNAAYEKRLRLIVPTDPSNPLKGLNARSNKRAVVFDQMTKTQGEYAAKVKALDNTNTDPDVVMLTVAEADLAQRTSDACQQLSTALTSHSDLEIMKAEVHLNALNNAGANLRTVRDLIRVKLGHKYEKDFPTLEETSKDSDAGPAEDAAKPKDSKASNITADATSKIPPAKAGKPGVLRVWTDRSGQHQTQAKYLGMENGKVKLEKADGNVVLVPLESLSEADQRFIGAAQ